jgi:TRAP-type C4-dicarboxylate transport system permease small subunit
MLATWQTFMNSVISHFPPKLQHPVEILIYFAILGAMAVIPLLLWLGWSVAATDLDDKS